MILCLCLSFCVCVCVYVCVYVCTVSDFPFQYRYNCSFSNLLFIFTTFILVLYLLITVIIFTILNYNYTKYYNNSAWIPKSCLIYLLFLVMMHKLWKLCFWENGLKLTAGFWSQYSWKHVSLYFIFVLTLRQDHLKYAVVLKSIILFCIITLF